MQKKSETFTESPRPVYVIHVIWDVFKMNIIFYLYAHFIET